MGKAQDAKWARREALREKGQFWTPDWVADAMVAYVGARNSAICDPAFGAGAFALAAQRDGLARSLPFVGFELDEGALAEARSAGVPNSILDRVELRDFLTVQHTLPDTGFVCNPPYIRHHRLDSRLKARLRQQTSDVVGESLDGRAGLHVHFLVHALSLLAEGRSLSFIVPADVCEGVFAHPLWQWIASQFRLDAVLTFAPEATPFPRVDTNPIVLMIRRTSPAAEYRWARMLIPDREALVSWVRSDFEAITPGAILAERRSVAEGVVSGVSRRQRDVAPGIPLGALVRVMRGIATGANEFFWLTSRQAAELDIPAPLLIRAVGRTRDVPSDTLRVEDLDRLDDEGRPTYLLSLDGRAIEDLPQALQLHLRAGEAAGLPQRPLIAQRRPWYRMERRLPPPFLFAYLGRRNARFIRNEAAAVPLTGFLCVYGVESSRDFLASLDSVLRDREALDGLPFVAKTYGGGALKVEPRSLERLHVPFAVLARAGIAEDVALKLAATTRRGQLTIGL